MAKESAMTTREMRGMAIANEIGRRNNPDVSIRRLNKLTYKGQITIKPLAPIMTVNKGGSRKQ